MNSQEPNKYVRLKRARITKAAALTRKSVSSRDETVPRTNPISRENKRKDYPRRNEKRSHFISFLSRRAKNSLRGFLSLPFVRSSYSLDGWALLAFF